MSLIRYLYLLVCKNVRSFLKLLKEIFWVFNLILRIFQLFSKLQKEKVFQFQSTSQFIIMFSVISFAIPWPLFIRRRIRQRLYSSFRTILMTWTYGTALTGVLYGTNISDNQFRTFIKVDKITFVLGINQFGMHTKTLGNAEESHYKPS